MKKVREFQGRAEECLAAAASASTVDLKGGYEGLARVWKKLADERLSFFVEEPSSGKPLEKMTGR
ncbi:MAG: hypothetical protein JO261_02100 [Alphaproteobacteria bacterium]|nr:hypothetical protein [Alphaproteobacteria bacterium]MBV9692471.1 hypothetical protein [Alphaproteobacteria bacterium]